jgi:putative ABC transport system permease protein
MSLSHGVTHAWRSLRRAPLFSASVILTLTVGIGSAAAIFAVVNAVLIRPLPYGHPDRLVGVWNDMPSVSLMHAQQTSGIYVTYERFARTLEGIAIYQDGSINVSDPDGRGEPQRIHVAWTSANAIPLLQVAPIVGRSYTAAEDAPKAPGDVVVISEGLWRARFGGDRSVIGKTLMLSGRPARIIGVMPARFAFPNATTQMWLPMRLDIAEETSGGFNYNAFARLKPGITVEAAQRDLANVLPRVVEVTPMMAPGVTMQMVMQQAKPVPRVFPMRDDVVGEVSRTLWMVAATAVLVLLVTCANVANLLLVRADGRHRELSVRAALGAGRNRVLAHFFTESALLAAISAVLGLGAAAIGIHFLVNSGSAQIPRLTEVGVDAGVISFTAIVAALVAFACSVIPAVRFSRGDPLSGLRDGGRGGTTGGKRQRARAGLVAAQMAFALVVLAASALLLRSFERLSAVRPGFNPNGVATLWLAAPSKRYPNDTTVVRFYARLAERVAAIPGVKAVGLASHLPLSMNGVSQDPFYVEGDASTATKIPPLELFVTVDSGYFNAMGIPLIAGHGFDQIERQHGDEAIISRETARTFFHDSTGRSALNKRFQVLPNGPWHTVVGVVGSVRDTSLSSGPTRTVYLPQSIGGDTVYGGVQRTLALIARTTGDVAVTTRAMQAAVREGDPTLPTFDVRSMRATMDASTARLSFTMIIVGVAAGVTLILSVIGLYGVIAYVVTLRTRELGVRLALGAQPTAVAAMVTKQGLALCGAGLAVGLVVVLTLGRLLRSQLFGVGPADPMAIGAATAILLMFSLLASWIPARRAARVNPTEALRSD